MTKKCNQVKVLVYNSNDVPELTNFALYIEQVSASFCKFISPSSNSGSTCYTVVYSDTDDEAYAENIVFACGYIHTEMLRQKRMKSANKRSSSLFCENIVFIFPNIDDATMQILFSWVHWTLKCRYTEQGILFGKFAKGTKEQSKDGRNLPVPPCHLFSVRDTILTRDPKFFEKAEWLLPSLEASNDLGHIVFSDLDDFSEVCEQVAVYCIKPSELLYKSIIDNVVNTGLYIVVKPLATMQLKKHDNQTQRRV